MHRAPTPAQRTQAHADTYSIYLTICVLRFLVLVGGGAHRQHAPRGAVDQALAAAGSRTRGARRERFLNAPSADGVRERTFALPLMWVVETV